MDILLATLLLCLPSLFLLLFLLQGRGRVENRHLSQIPLAPRCLPLLGHSWYLLTDMRAFFHACAVATRSSVFRVKIFGQDWIYFCDREHARDFLKGPESQISVFTIFNLDESFAADGLHIQTVMDLTRTGFNVHPKTYLATAAARVQSSMDWLETSLATRSNHTAALQEMAFEMHAAATTECICGVELSAKALSAFITYEKVYHYSAALNSLLPTWLVSWAVGSWLKRLREDVVAEVVATLPNYQNDPSKDDSRLMRVSADVTNTATGKPLSSRDVGGIVANALVMGSRNVPILFANTLADLATNPESWSRAREEVKELVERGDWDAVINAPYLTACVSETELRSMGVWTFQRITITDYQIGDVTIPPNTMVCLYTPLMKFNEAPKSEYEAPAEYDPTRFLPYGKANNLLTFGGGKHLCPGKQFSLNEIKIAVALFLVRFEMEIIPQADFSLDYFATSTLSERRFRARITKR